MANTKIKGAKIAAVVSSVPAVTFDNLTDTTQFTQDEVRKVVGMAGIHRRRISGDSLCSSDLCTVAAEAALEAVKWERGSVDALIMVTQTPDYFLPQTSCVIHKQLGLSDRCATFDVGLGCSGYPYGLWLASMMIHSSGFRRVLLLHGDTPSRYAEESDRSVALLFGDAGSATAIEADTSDDAPDWFFSMHSDGSGCSDMIIEGGGFRERFPEDKHKYYVRVKGANVFNFTIKRIPALIQETLDTTGVNKEDVDYFIFHQSNKYIIDHLTNKLGIQSNQVPLTLKEFGNTGGPSIPLTITQGGLERPPGRSLLLMLLGYGVGLSWSSALITLGPDAVLEHRELKQGE